MDNFDITIIRGMSGEADETGAGGLWDLARRLAALARGKMASHIPDYGDACTLPLDLIECGQEEIYHELIKYVKE